MCCSYAPEPGPGVGDAAEGGGTSAAFLVFSFLWVRRKEAPPSLDADEAADAPSSSTSQRRPTTRPSHVRSSIPSVNTASAIMQQERESADLCSNGCGFFGSSASGGMCSLCWKKCMSNRQVEAAKPVKVEQQQPDKVENNVENNVAEVTAAPAEEAAAEAVEAKPVQTNRKRCWECKKKVGLTAIECRCGFVFCNAHRYADQHACSFDFKAADRAELARRNPGGGQFGKLDKL
ncbi:TPA: hypothetical protein N0F65_003005 [Lagenidium giganteum]|uniref:Uncharacterized protein n=1 Tax=Lagenidium giganteum TaxID=4803 RepID=A0AAV2YNZ4_9STRA|nr:TPA: hypothetical protein N0F65_003005 [Lagenidium giganteum]